MFRILFAAALLCAPSVARGRNLRCFTVWRWRCGYHGRRTASGAIFHTYASNPYTVAHKTRPLGSFVTITNLANGRSIRAKVTDRGPFIAGRCVDLGRAGATALGMGGTARVSVQ